MPAEKHENIKPTYVSSKRRMVLHETKKFQNLPGYTFVLWEVSDQKF